MAWISCQRGGGNAGINGGGGGYGTAGYPRYLEELQERHMAIPTWQNCTWAREAVEAMEMRENRQMRASLVEEEAGSS